MKKVIIENTEIAVSRVAYGTGALHHLPFCAERLRVLSAAVDGGITHFDTAPYYGYGLAEVTLGRFLRGRRSGVTIATKVGLYPCGAVSPNILGVWGRKAFGTIFPRLSAPSVDWQVDRARKSLRNSLKRLQVEYVDFLFLHEPDISLLNAEEFLRWLESENAQGRVRAWGVAGVGARVRPFVLAGGSLAKVVQTSDSLERREADFLSEHRRALQFTYGYLSGRGEKFQAGAAEDIVRGALQRNRSGAIVVSSRNPERIAQLAKAGG